MIVLERAVRTDPDSPGRARARTRSTATRSFFGRYLVKDVLRNIFFHL
jgi:hypothetical protein